MLNAADERRSDRASVLILDDEAVLRERDQIVQLIVGLRSGETVSARGVALVRLLIRDYRGPLYHHQDGQTLHDALATAARALTEPQPAPVFPMRA